MSSTAALGLRTPIRHALEPDVTLESVSGAAVMGLRDAPDMAVVRLPITASVVMGGISGTGSMGKRTPVRRPMVASRTIGIVGATVAMSLRALAVIRTPLTASVTMPAATSGGWLFLYPVPTIEEEPPFVRPLPKPVMKMVMGQGIPFGDYDRQSLIVRLAGVDCRLHLWWQPSDQNWYMTLENL